MIVIGGEFPLEVGTIEELDITDRHADWHTVPVRVVRQVTYEEYVAFCENDQATGNKLPRSKAKFCYEVIVD